MESLEVASSRNSPPEDKAHDHCEETIEVKVSGEGNGLVDDETSGHAIRAEHPLLGKTANERLGGEGDQDATSQ